MHNKKRRLNNETAYQEKRWSEFGHMFLLDAHTKNHKHGERRSEITNAHVERGCIPWKIYMLEGFKRTLDHKNLNHSVP